MKFLPYLLRPTALLMLVTGISACSTPANRRELYNTTESKSGVWHDYDRRRQAEAATGVSGGTAPTVLPGRERPTAPPPSSAAPGALPPGTTLPAPTLQAPLSPETGAPAPVVPAPADATAPVLPATPDAAGPAPVVPDPTAATPAQ